MLDDGTGRYGRITETEMAGSEAFGADSSCDVRNLIAFYLLILDRIFEFWIEIFSFLDRILFVWYGNLPSVFSIILHPSTTIDDTSSHHIIT
jgi:hypothetical protein